MSITVQRCSHCGGYLFPYRLLCPTCGSSEFADTEVDSGTVEVVTHTAGGVTIATVVCEKELRIVARLHPADVAAGDVVALTDDNTDSTGSVAFVPVPDHRTPGKDDQ